MARTPRTHVVGGTHVAITARSGVGDMPACESGIATVVRAGIAVVALRIIDTFETQVTGFIAVCLIDARRRADANPGPTSLRPIAEKAVRARNFVVNRRMHAFVQYAGVRRTRI